MKVMQEDDGEKKCKMELNGDDYSVQSESWRLVSQMLNNRENDHQKDHDGPVSELPKKFKFSNTL